MLIILIKYIQSVKKKNLTKEKYKDETWITNNMIRMSILILLTIHRGLATVFKSR